MKLNFIPKNGKLIACALIFHGMLMACTLEEQKQARGFFTHANETESYSNAIRLLNASLKSCFSSHTQSELYLVEGDFYYESGDYAKAKQSYSSIIQETANIKDPKLKNRYKLLYYKSMKDVYDKMGKNNLSAIMEQKYNLSKPKERQVINKAYVNANTIYKQLNPSAKEISSALRAMGVIKKEINLAINFQYNSSKLDKKGKRQAIALGEASQKILRKNTNGRIEIIGYTDTSGNANYNLQLSKKRAKEIRAFLLDYYAIDSLKISYRGKGEQKPICSDSISSTNKAMGVIAYTSSSIDENDSYRDSHGEYHCHTNEDKEASRRVEVRFILPPN